MNISLRSHAGEIRGRVSRVGRQWGEEAIHTLLTLEVGYITKHQHPIAGWVHYRTPLPYDEVRSPLNVVLDDLQACLLLTISYHPHSILSKVSSHHLWVMACRREGEVGLPSGNKASQGVKKEDYFYLRPEIKGHLRLT